MLTQPTPEHRDALVTTLARDRLKRFRAVFGGDTTQAVALYHLDLTLASALHNLLAVAEVCLREAMHRQLTELLGPQWYVNRHGLFDERTQRNLATAMAKVKGPRQPGKVVAEITFGTWTGLLEPGGWTQHPTGRARTDYEATLWTPALKDAFPRSSGVRAEVAEIALRVRYARNRVAHYEPVVFGVPLPGRGSVGARQIATRRTPTGVLEDIRSLVGLIDPGLEDWLRTSTTADDLARSPAAQLAVDYMSSRVNLL